MSARAKSPPGKGKGKAEATPEELAAAEAARLGGALAAAEADKAKEAADRNYAQLERVRPSFRSFTVYTGPNARLGAGHAAQPAGAGCCASRLRCSALRLLPGVSLTGARAPRPARGGAGQGA